MAEALRDGGYQTWHVGKWHLAPEGNGPEDFGFDTNVAGCAWGMPHNGYFSPYGMPNLADGPDGEYLTDRLTDEAIGLLRTRDTDRPFFLHLSHYAVHTPIQTPAKLITKYEHKASELGLDQIDAVEEGEHFPALHKKDRHLVRRKIQSDAAYAAMVENLDTNVGRLLDALQQQGLAEDTLVMFTSDNGGLATAEGSPTCNLPLAEGKGWMYDGGIREPLIARWPRVIEPGSSCTVPVTSTDFYPTFLEAAGLPLRPRQHADGESLMPLLRGTGELQREAIFWHYPHYSNQSGTPACAVRAGEWKLIEFFEDNRLELYHLHSDIEERHDRADDEPQRVKQLHHKLLMWRKSIEAQIPQPNRHYEAMRSGRMPVGHTACVIPGDDRQLE